VAEQEISLAKGEKLFEEIRKLSTEQRNPATEEIDLAESLEIVELINNEDRKVAEAVGLKKKEIADAINLVTSALKNGGRLLYFGAGTSGRLGVLDAAECPPTFGTPPDLVQGFIAGGMEAMFVAQEGAEDYEENGEKDVNLSGVNSKDVVIGLAASGRTPYVHGALKASAERGAATVFVTTVPQEQLNIEADVIIDVPVGPEVIMGSTRMKSATAQKMILNMISTGAMIRMGKVYKNVMVDLMQTNQKLVERSKRIIMMFSGIGYEEAGDLLHQAGGKVKTALVMAISGERAERARELLEENHGFIRRVIEQMK
jgi:N-acetylmuramic acid 6-phosphate etherase